MTEIAFLSAVEATRRFRDRSLSPVELIEAAIARYEAVNPAVNAFTITFFEQALEQARESERRYARGQAMGSLDGVPLALKDATYVKGQVSTMGSRLYTDYVPQRTDPATQRLLEAGAIIIGRTTMPEFGESANCYTPLWGVTRNPWNTDYGPGGSSSGSACAIAAGMATISDGSDLGGSLRIPAACCGVVGFKPPFGRNPLGAHASFDPYQHYGPITRSVADAARMQNVMCGAHIDDVHSLRHKITLPEDIDPDPRGWKIAYSLDLGFYQLDHAVRDNMLSLLDALRGLGCDVREVDLGWNEDVFFAWQTINAVRGVAARYTGGREDWREVVADYTLDWLDARDELSSEDVVGAYQVHIDMYGSLAPILEDCQAFICPTNAIPSIEADRSPLDLDFNINDEPANPIVAEAWFMTYPFNLLAELPVMSVPSGFAPTGVPTGIQIVSRSFDDERVFAVARALERELRWDRWRTPI